MPNVIKNIRDDTETGFDITRITPVPTTEPINTYAQNILESNYIKTHNHFFY